MQLALRKRLTDIVNEYNIKKSDLSEELKIWEAASERLKVSSCISGTWGGGRVEAGHIYESDLQDNLLKSAWRHIYKGMNIELIASAKDKNLFEQSMINPAPFTIDNIRGTFGDYIADPRGNILRSLAEVFGELDPAYKSHDKVKIGVKGLPKRIILTNVGGFSAWGRDRLQNVLNALAQVEGKPLLGYFDVNELLKRGEYLKEERGVRLVTFANGNGHLFFEPEQLKIINLALAEYYGEVLPDAPEPDAKKQKSTAVSKDLQYYPTPLRVIKNVIEEIYIPNGETVKILEPSCGCGLFMDALRDKGADVFGIEYDRGRVAETKAKGHSVLQANFLEVVPNPIYDYVVMNPPFYGKHYAKHIDHAMKFLKKGGRLKAVLPVTARYDHGLITDPKAQWHDLPIGSFRESGTNINTTVLTLYKI